MQKSYVLVHEAQSMAARAAIPGAGVAVTMAAQRMKMMADGFMLVGVSWGFSTGDVQESRI